MSILRQALAHEVCAWEKVEENVNTFTEHLTPVGSASFLMPARGWWDQPPKALGCGRFIENPYYCSSPLSSHNTNMWLKLNLVKGWPLEIKASHFQCGPFASNTDKTQIQTTALHNEHAQQLPDSTLMLHIIFTLPTAGFCDDMQLSGWWVAGGFGTGYTSILVQ